MLRSIHTARSAAARRLSTFAGQSYYRTRIEPLESRHLLSATLISVDTFDDVIDAGDGVTSLREAIREANASPDDYEIQLAAGTYPLTIQGVSENAALTGDLDILANGSVKIVGTGAATTTIDAGFPPDETDFQQDGIFQVLPGADVDFVGLTLTGGSTGAIINFGQVTITASALSRNQGFVATIYNNSNGQMTLTDSVVVENGYFGFGSLVGGIHNEGTMTIARSTISGNSGLNVGGVLNDGELTITDSTVSDNSIFNYFDVGAGGIGNRGTLTVIRTTVSGNAGFSKHYETVSATGGIANYGAATIIESAISHNIGDGIRNTDTLTITSSTVANNSPAEYLPAGIFADGGSGLRNLGSAFVANSTISGNATETQGGAIFNQGTATVSGSLVSENSAREGGAIYNVAGGTLTVTDTTLSKNAAVFGGAIDNEFGTVTIAKSTITDNTARGTAGGIYSEGGTVLISGSTLAGNSSNRDAGGIYQQGNGLLVVTDSTIAGNSAIRDGGALYNTENGTVILRSTAISDNSARNGGGIYNIEDGTVMLTAITFTGNSSSEHGGAIYNGIDATATFADVALAQNSADESGGGIANFGDATIALATLSDNTASLQGGAIYNDASGVLTLADGSLFGNSADEDGGAISNYGELSVIDSTLKGHVGGFSSSTILTSGTATIIDSTFLDNDLAILNSGTATVSNSILSNGSFGAIRNSGTLTLTGSTLANHQQSAVHNTGTVTIADSMLIDNVSVLGAAIENIGTATIASTTIANNVSMYGAISTDGSITLTNTTLSGNSARFGGGIYGVGGPIDIRHSTITGNVASDDGGALYIVDGTVTLDHTIVAGNLLGAMSNDIALGQFAGPQDVTSSYSLIGDPTTAAGIMHGTAGNIVGDGLGNPLDIDSVLDTTLTDNGGPTLTHALLIGSPARNAGDPLFDPNTLHPSLLFDQRGPGFQRVVDGRIDIGAYEGSLEIIAVDVFEDSLADDGLWSLREAVIYANTHPGDFEIQLAAGAYPLTIQGEGEDDAMTGDLDLLDNGGIRILAIGAGVTTIDATGLVFGDYGDRIFDVLGATVYLEGLTLTGGRAHSGGAISNVEGQVTIKHGTLSNNSATYDGSAILNDGRMTIIDSTISGNSGEDNISSGAIHNDGRMTIIGSTISGNSAQGYLSSGAIHNDGRMTIVDSMVSGNTGVYAANSGGIYNNGRMTIIDTTISDNAGEGFANSGLATIIGSTFSSNGASGIRNSGNATIVDSTFSSNISMGISNVGSATIVDSTASGNTGPGIGNGSGSELRLIDSTATDNTSDSRGGGMSNRGHATIVGSTIADNTTDSTGGGFYNHEHGRATLIHSAVTDNTADSRGGGIDNSGDITLIDTTLGANTADRGGGLYTSGLATLISTTVSANFGGSGGGVYATGGGRLTVTRSLISTNSGGGIFSGTGSQLIVDDSTIAGNSAAFGGGISAQGRTTISGSTVTGNVADSGAGISNSGELRITNSTISGNLAERSGGGIRNSSNLSISHSTITGNRAKTESSDGLGGGIYVISSAATTRLMHTIVAGNFLEKAPGEIPSDIELTVGQLDAASSYNLIGDPDTAGGLVHGTDSNIVGDGSGNTLDVATVLDKQLSNNEGPTLTHALVAGSPALNAGDANFVSPPLFDQRGVGFPRVEDGRIDIGAYEGLAVPLPEDTVIAIDTFDDVVADDGLWSLREAIIYANNHRGNFIIQLAAGTYTLTIRGAVENFAQTGDLDVLNNGSLKILGAGAETTTVDASALGDRIFDVQTGTVSEFNGLTLTGGDAPDQDGGAIRNAGGRLTITASAILGNHSSPSSEGGGIFSLVGSELTITGTKISGNVSRGGGGISSHGQATITNSEILDNSANGPGGGISSSGNMTITDSIVSDNGTSSLGGGIYNSAGTLRIITSDVSRNRGHHGGGITNREGGSLVVTSSTVSNNVSAEEGGGIFTDGQLWFRYGTVVVTNSTISGNIASTDGGAIYTTGNGSLLAVRHSTLTGNRAQTNTSPADYTGGGLYLDVGTISTLENTIVAGNLLGRLPPYTPNDIAGGGQLDAASSYNLIGDPDSAGGLVHGTAGNIVGDELGNLLPTGLILDPNLADNGGPTLTHAAVYIGPAVNAGDPNFVPPPDYDQRGPGFPRIDNGRIDIGAYEAAANPAPVDGMIVVDVFEDSLAADGLWSLREAVIYANTHPGDFEIKLAAGTYLLTIQGDENAALAGDLDILANGSLKITGVSAASTTIDAGYRFEETDGLGDRIFDVHSDAVVDFTGLTLTGGANVFGGAIQSRESQVTLAASVVTKNSVYSGAIFNIAGQMTLTDSIVIDNAGTFSQLGGIFNSGAMTIIRTTLSGNSGEFAGAIYNSDQLSLTDSTVSGNLASGSPEGGAGGIANIGTLTITSSTVSGNAGYLGIMEATGGIANYGTATIVDSGISNNIGDGIGNTGTLTITSSTVSGNSPSENLVFGGQLIDVGGSGLHNLGTALIADSTFSGNVAGGLGGAIYNLGFATITGSMFLGNTAEYDGGGIYTGYGGTVAISNSTVSGNTANSGGGIYNDNGTAALTNVTVSGNTAGRGGGIYNENATVELTNVTVSGNTVERDGGGIFINGPTGQVTIHHSTITANRANTDGTSSATGGGLFLRNNANATLDHTIVAGNLRGADPGGTPNDIAVDSGQLDAASSYNLIGDPDSAGGLVHGTDGNIVGDGLGNLLPTNLILDPNLADNGGPTLTHALVAGSQAINAGDPLFDPNTLDPPLLYDQRGPGFPRVVGDVIDIGAFELRFEAEVLARRIFYNNSAFDDKTPGASPADASAIATDKSAYLPDSGSFTYANATNYSQGINGIMVELTGAHGTITAADFTVRMSGQMLLANTTPGSWSPAPTPTVTVFSDTPTVGTDRVELIWPDGAIVDRYLEVTFEGFDAAGGFNVNTGLVASDTFYFANLIGDTFSNYPGYFITDAMDVLEARNNQGVADSVTNPYDFNRDRFVDATDQIIARSNQAFMQAHSMSSPPAPNPADDELDTSAVASALSMPSVSAARQLEASVDAIVEAAVVSRPVAHRAVAARAPAPVSAQTQSVPTARNSVDAAFDDDLLDSLLADLKLW